MKNCKHTYSKFPHNKPNYSCWLSLDLSCSSGHLYCDFICAYEPISNEINGRSPWSQPRFAFSSCHSCLDSSQKHQTTYSCLPALRPEFPWKQEEQVLGPGPDMASSSQPQTDKVDMLWLHKGAASRVYVQADFLKFLWWRS